MPSTGSGNDKLKNSSPALSLPSSHRSNLSLLRGERTEKKLSSTPKDLKEAKEGEDDDEDDDDESSDDEDEFISRSKKKNPPIQNGFVVFIHQCKVGGNYYHCLKGRRTVAQWIRDALKMMDIVPQTITIDTLVEQSKMQFPSPKDEPLIKYAKLPSSTSRTAAASSSKPESSKTTILPKALKTATSKAVVQTKKSVTSTASRFNFPPLSRKNSAAVNKSTSSKSSRSTVSSSQKSESKSSQQQRNTSPGKPKTTKATKSTPVVTAAPEEDAKQVGVELKIFRRHVRALQQENPSSVWVLLVETKQRCMVDLGRLHKLASKYRFQVKWIASQSPSSLDLTVFNVVNDIVQTRNICFPESLTSIALAQPSSPPTAIVESVSKIIKRRRSKKSRTSVQVLHKTSAEEFDATSVASLSEREAVTNHDDAKSKEEQGKSETNETENEGNQSENSDGTFALKRQMSKEEIHKALEEDANNQNTATTEEENANLIRPEGLLVRPQDTPPLPLPVEESTRLVQLALISTKNPFATPWLRTDGLFASNEELKKRSKLQTTRNAEPDENAEALTSPTQPFQDCENRSRNIKRAFHAVTRKFKKRPFGPRSGKRLNHAGATSSPHGSPGARTSSNPQLGDVGDNEFGIALSSMSSSFVPLTTEKSKPKAEPEGLPANVIDAKSLAEEDEDDDETFESIELSEYSSESGVQSSDEETITKDCLNLYGSSPVQRSRPEVLGAKLGAAIISSSSEDLSHSQTCIQACAISSAESNKLSSGAPTDTFLHNSVERNASLECRNSSQPRPRSGGSTRVKQRKQTYLSKESFLGCFGRWCNCSVPVTEN